MVVSNHPTRQADIQDAVCSILKVLEGVNHVGSFREGIVDTPSRVAKYWLEVTKGASQSPADVMKVFEDGADKVDQMIFQGNIPFFSQCEHHMVPFFGVAHMAYIPGKDCLHENTEDMELVRNDKLMLSEVRKEGHRQKILGLSKFARLLEIFTRRLQVQERIGTQVADAMVEHLRPQGAAIVLRARHLCMESRGVQKIGTVTMTSTLRGAFMTDPTVRAEFMQFVAMAENRSPNI